MRLVFAGTPEFAATALNALLAAGHEIALVMTQPDRPSGRGMKLAISPVKKLALEHNLPLFQPDNLRSTASLAAIAAAKVDAMVVAAYGLILPPAILALPRFGCINIHASLLPRWRGAAPIQRALLAGDIETGISIMQMDAGLDSGPLLLQQTVGIEMRETGQSLHDKLAATGARCIVAALEQITAGNLQAIAQPAQGATYAAKLLKTEASIDWRQSAAGIDRVVRAFNPAPLACAQIRETALKLWRAPPVAAIAGAQPPGTIVRVGADGVTVSCGEGEIRIEELQKAGGKRLAAGAFLRGFPMQAGDRFEIPAVR
ncbi:MAG: methionyl-tRNA formyltransferase [Burkholderiales bacterium]|nr:methionyl-tRNA formyltransferase [Burkholderiales bacterium]MDQ3194875.1 methionyl-tRNA formyltransferase [Pseudomonadota bacterium]